MRYCTIVVENLPVPFDRRVWQEACALRDAGWGVSIISPATDTYPSAFEVLEDIEIHRHRLPVEASRRSEFAREYASALFHEFQLLVRLARRGRVDVIQACNPPDLIFLIALPFKLLGRKFVFDQHDVCPELFEAKFGPDKLLRSILLLLEKLTFWTADLVISTNETFREVAMQRGGKKPEDVVTVYSVPTAARIRRTEPEPALRAGVKHVVGYVGVIGGQDGVDHLVRATHSLKATGVDFRTVIVGDGPALPSVRALARELDVEDKIVFTGYLENDALRAALSSFDVGVIPDPPNEYNHKVSMNKVFEYSALGVPVVAYPLRETQRLMGEAGEFAASDRPKDLADAIGRLLEDDALRAQRGSEVAALASEKFSWDREAAAYVAAFDRLLPAK